MLLKKIHCLYFKNYTAIELNFSDQLNFFVGNNGSGKTNLLDAMHYLSLTKSAFNLADTQNIQHGADFFSVTGHFFKDKTNHDLQCIVKKNQKKIFKINQQPYDKLSDHIGLFPMVLLTPNDKDLIRGGGEARRSFFDSVLCQLDSHYLHTLMQYNHLLKQRNRLLKLHASGAPLDEDLLHTYSQQLLPLGRMIFEARKKFMQTFYTSFQHYHAWVTAADEAVACDYQSALAEPDFEQRFFKSISQDLALQRTTMGIHLDDFVFTLQGYLLKKIGSQGQQQSFVIALKLAQFDCLQQALGVKPLLLLDDIFEALDTQRVDRLVQLITQKNFGQLFITDAKGTSIAKIKKNGTMQRCIFKIKDGRWVG